MLDQCLFVDIGHPSLEEMGSSAEELMVKARKPYTLTKQRKKWTDEEHEKFLEALKLYGRAWSQIQEHIGTKTAVQIRSHAQKFFSKVAREPGSGNHIIEIPPPRPKRKHLRPYPIKLAQACSKEFRVLDKRDWSSSLVPSIFEQDSSSAVSETMNSSVSYNLNCSSLQFSTAAGSAELPFSQHKAKSCSTAILSVEHNISSSPGITSNSLIKQDGESVDHDPGFQKISLEETSLLEMQPITLKLFGSKLLITSSRKEISINTGSPQCCSGKDIAIPEKITAAHEHPSGFSQGESVESMECRSFSWNIRSRLDEL